MNTIQASGNYNFQQILNFFGLSHNPFPMAPDNTDFFISLHHDKVIAKLTQAVFARKGFMLLTGEIGLGKTTLSRRIIHILEQNHVEISLIFQSFYQGKNLLKEIIKDFGIQVNDTQQDISVLMTRLNTFLLEKNQTKNQTKNQAIKILGSKREVIKTNTSGAYGKVCVAPAAILKTVSIMSKN